MTGWHLLLQSSYRWQRTQRREAWRDGAASALDCRDAYHNSSPEMAPRTDSPSVAETRCHAQETLATVLKHVANESHSVQREFQKAPEGEDAAERVLGVADGASLLPCSQKEDHTRYFEGAVEDMTAEERKQSAAWEEQFAEGL